MSQSFVGVQLPPGFSPQHESAVIGYLADSLAGSTAWAMAFQAFDILDQAVLITTEGRRTFRALYREIADSKWTDPYLRELMALEDIDSESPALWARYARRIVDEFTGRGWRRADVPDTRLLLSYLLYWWGAFARGYALEVVIFRDLKRSGLRFQAHNLLDRRGRYSASDLTVQGMAGDIKTSVYFVQAATLLRHDFYVVRLWTRGRVSTVVVLLQPPAWDTINGDTMDGDLDDVTDLRPVPVRIRRRGHELVVLDYDEWKRRILRRQGADQ
jgi:hypothetical protein